MRIIAGAFGGRALRTVDGPGYRPAMSRVRESLFSMLEARGVVWSACAVLDLFAGSGSLAFEAASRGAPRVTLVESSAQAMQCLRRNAAALGLDVSRCRLAAEDVLRFLRTPPTEPFNVVFIDPPYGKQLLSPALRALLRQGWVAPDALIAAEVEASLPAAATACDALEALTERTFGQTRILLWKNTSTA